MKYKPFGKLKVGECFINSFGIYVHKKCNNFEINGTVYNACRLERSIKGETIEVPVFFRNDALVGLGISNESLDDNQENTVIYPAVWHKG
ncbi:hypothetical protein KC723_01935 [Candidatus Kaiserbacteria bacterium]|nr:hypothetical protein [Candidatus Kaiserbacteria bacterium]